MILERQGQRPERPPPGVHAPGLGYFGVKLRPDAREVTKRRSPPKPDLMMKFASESLKETGPRVRARAVRGGVAELSSDRSVCRRLGVGRAAVYAVTAPPWEVRRLAVRFGDRSGRGYPCEVTCAARPRCKEVRTTAFAEAMPGNGGPCEGCGVAVPARREVGAGPVFEPVTCAWAWASVF